VRPLCPGRLLRIVSFPSRQFSSHGTKPGTFGIGSLQKILLVRAAMFFLGAVIAIPNLAQSQPAVAFRFFKEVHWGSAVLQPGDYIVSISAGAAPVVTVVQKGGASAATIAPRAVSSEPFSGNTRVVMNDDSAGDYVTSLYLKNTQTVFTFAAPGTQPQPTSPSTPDLSPQKVASSNSASDEGGLFTIDNRRSQAWPHAEAQALYLSACKVVEQEFARTDPIRPRLTLVLGASAAGVDYPKHEIQLTKWDKYEFAQGVVLLAVSDILPHDMRISLTRLAVVEAESTVGIDELRK
jgi:hypothetical protein